MVVIISVLNYMKHLFNGGDNGGDNNGGDNNVDAFITQ
jgi:hypothetical protein